MSTPDLQILGGGLLGRLLAWRASLQGLKVTLYDAGSPQGERSAAWAAAGMITPAAEAVDTDPEIVAMGRHTLTLWPQWLAQLPTKVFYRDAGTLLLWHREDTGESQRFETLLKTRDPQANLLHLDASQIADLEPTLATRFPRAFYLPDEAQIDNRDLLSAVAQALDQSQVECHWHTTISPEDLPKAALAVDCRGMGAKPNLPQLRGVRGEIARLHAPDIDLRHMLRLLHPRLSLYIAPRPAGVLVVGATTVESEDRSPVSVRGALELLSTAYSLLPALAEARILEFATQLRPALPDNKPALRYDPATRLMSVNGLYRHGFLLSPTIVESVLSFVTSTNQAHDWPCLRLPPESSIHLAQRFEMEVPA